MKLFRKINNEGLFIEDVLLEERPFTYDENFEKIYDEHYIETPVPPGFYWPKWNGEKWVEGGEAPLPQPIELTDTEKLQARVNTLEDTLLMLMMEV